MFILAKLQLDRKGSCLSLSVELEASKLALNFRSVRWQEFQWTSDLRWPQCLRPLLAKTATRRMDGSPVMGTSLHRLRLHFLAVDLKIFVARMSLCLPLLEEKQKWNFLLVWVQELAENTKKKNGSNSNGKWNRSWLGKKSEAEPTAFSLGLLIN